MKRKASEDHRARDARADGDDKRVKVSIRHGLLPNSSLRFDMAKADLMSRPKSNGGLRSITVMERSRRKPSSQVIAGSLPRATKARKGSA